MSSSEKASCVHHTANAEFFLSGQPLRFTCLQGLNYICCPNIPLGVLILGYFRHNTLIAACVVLGTAFGISCSWDGNFVYVVPAFFLGFFF